MRLEVCPAPILSFLPTDVIKILTYLLQLQSKPGSIDLTISSRSSKPLENVRVELYLGKTASGANCVESGASNASSGGASGGSAGSGGGWGFDPKTNVSPNKPPAVGYAARDDVPFI